MSRLFAGADKVAALTKRNARNLVFERDGWRCSYCGRDFSGLRRKTRLRLLTLDHVVPRSRGGSDNAENLVASCVKCNGEKRNRTPDEWKRGE